MSKTVVEEVIPSFQLFQVEAGGARKIMKVPADDILPKQIHLLVDCSSLEACRGPHFEEQVSQLTQLLQIGSRSNCWSINWAIFKSSHGPLPIVTGYFNGIIHSIKMGFTLSNINQLF